MKTVIGSSLRRSAQYLCDVVLAQLIVARR